MTVTPTQRPGAPGPDVFDWLDAVFRNSTDAIVLADGAGTLCYATAGAELLTGHDAGAMIGSSVFDFLHPDDVAAASQLFARRLEYDGADLGHEIRVRHASGDWVPTLATASLLPDGSVGACAITLRSLAGEEPLERSLRSRIVVGEYVNRLGASFMLATHSAAVIEQIQQSLSEIGLLTGAEVVEVLLERQQRGSVERLAHWVTTAGAVADTTAVVGVAAGPKLVEQLLSEEFVDDDTAAAGRRASSAFWERVGIAGLLSAPFVAGEQRGVLVLMRVEPGPSWTAADCELVRGVANLFGRALQTARSEELLALTYREGPLGFSICTWDGRLVDCNRRYLDVVQLSREDVAEGRFSALLALADRNAIAGGMERLRRGEIDRLRTDVELTRQDRAVFWVQLTAVPLRVPGSSERLVLTSVEDVTETHQQRSELEHAALHDPLTGLANRVGMTRAIERLADERGEHPALLFVDLDRFRFVNQSLGHTAGDRVLQVVARVLASAVGPDDVVARLGGDEFAVVVPQLTPSGAHRLARRLVATVDPAIEVDGRSITLALSVGVALGADAASAADLLVRADRALDTAKTSGRNGYVVYDAAVEDEVLARHDLERELRSALADGRLAIHFQPEFSVADGRIVGAEALLRWDHPERGWLTADAFIVTAEHTGMIDEIGRFALRAACRSFAAIDGTSSLTLRVNISAREFARRELPDLVRSALDEAQLDPQRLCLEMTETTLMDAPEVALDTIARLRAIGVHSAIDDFGTGYSSLAYLKRFPVDAVKIDRTFVDDVVTDADSRTIVESIVGLGDALSFQVVAEGVETEAQLRVLGSLGVRRAQGFVVAPALPPGEFADLLARNAEGAVSDGLRSGGPDPS